VSQRAVFGKSLGSVARHLLHTRNTDEISTSRTLLQSSRDELRAEETRNVLQHNYPKAFPSSHGLETGSTEPARWGKHATMNRCGDEEEEEILHATAQKCAWL